MRFLLWATVVAGVAASLALSYGIATQAFTVGSQPDGAVYFYLQPFSVRAMAVFAAASALTAALLCASERVIDRREWLAVLLWFVAAIAIEGLICSLAPFRFEQIFLSDGANAFNSVARRYDPATMLGEFEHIRKDWPPHGQSNMPGKSVFVSVLRHASKRADILPWLVVVVSNLGGVLLYALARDLLNDRRTALYALALYVVVPGKMFYFPLLNTVTPVAVLLSAWLLVRWLRTSNLVYAACCGVSIYLIAFWEPLGLVIGLLFGALMASAIARGAIRPATLLWQGAAALAAFAAVYAVMVVQYRFDLLPIVRLLAADASRFNVDAQRPYDAWVRLNLADFLVGLGACQAVLFVGALGDGLTRAGDATRRLAEPVVVFVLGLVAVVVATDLIGVNRGEVVRLWIFLACIGQIPAAYVCARLDSRLAFVLVLTATLLHDALGTAMIGFILPG